MKQTFLILMTFLVFLSGSVFSQSKRIDDTTFYLLDEISKGECALNGITNPAMMDSVSSELVKIWRACGSPKIRRVKNANIRAHEGGPLNMMWLNDFSDTKEFFAELAHVKQFASDPAYYTIVTGWIYGRTFVLSLFIEKDSSQSFVEHWQQVYTERAYKSPKAGKHAGYEFEAHGCDYSKDSNGDWQWTDYETGIEKELNDYFQLRINELVRKK